MKEKEITLQESVAVINEMIQRSKIRCTTGDGNILLLWGYSTVGVSLLVWGLLELTHNPAVHWLWFLLGIICGLATPIMARKYDAKAGVITYIDRICGRAWALVGYSAFALTIICFGFSLIGDLHAWRGLILIPLLFVRYAEAVQGAAIREKSLILGGGIGILAGLITLSCFAAGVPLHTYWFVPVFIFSFALMTIMPGHILNYKSRKER